MTKKEARIEALKMRIRTTEGKGFGTSGVIRKLKRELRKLGVY